MPDIHAGLQTELLTSHSGGGVQFQLAKVIHGRDRVAYGLHASVHTYFSASVSPQDFLLRLGFRSEDCPFVSGSEIYCLAIDEDLDTAAFVDVFGTAFDALREAQHHLNQCGFYLESGDFPAKAWVRGGGDGHTGTGQKRMKESSDEHFDFVFSWLKQGGSEGWTAHYRAKAQPASVEMRAALEFLGLREWQECIEFDFEPCRWRHVLRDATRDRFFANNETVHGWFDAHAEHFSAGIERLLMVDRLVQPFGMGHLQSTSTQGRNRPTPRTPARAIARDDGRRGDDEDYDVALSFAGTDRERAETLDRME